MGMAGHDHQRINKMRGAMKLRLLVFLFYFAPLDQGGADPEPRDIYGVTPLHDACEDGRVEVVSALLEAGADPSPVRLHLPLKCR